MNTVNTDTLAQDIALLRAFVQGDDATVMLGGVATPTVRSLIRTISTKVDVMLAQARAYEDRVARLERLMETAGLTVVDEQGKTYSIQILGGLVSDAGVGSKTS